ncbi:hypothetical protein BLFGPEAP_02219 [Candidatus Methanoperedenaceae archaeon GB50]|nr:hypothetical protein BLFGPEAP_02219 [Candidatus Methanoperedenaceae archaeon GB50]
MSKIVKIGNVEIGGKSPLVLISGPCVIEGEEITYQTCPFFEGIDTTAQYSLYF